MTFPHPAGNAVISAPQGTVGLPGCLDTLLTHVQFAVAQDPQSLSVGLLSSVPSPSQCVCPGLHLPSCRIRHLFLLCFMWLELAQFSNFFTSLCKASPHYCAHLNSTKRTSGSPGHVRNRIPFQPSGFPSEDEMPNPRGTMEWSDSNRTKGNGFKVQREDLVKLLGRIFLLKGSGTGCSKIYCVPHPWRHSRSASMGSWAA